MNLGLLLSRRVLIIAAACVVGTLALILGAGVFMANSLSFGPVVFREPEPVAEIVLRTGTVLTVGNPQGTFSDHALSPQRREFIWDGHRAQVVLASRGLKYRWYGKLGIYHPSASLHAGETGVFEEAQIHFDNRSGALAWLNRVRGWDLLYMWTGDGLLVSFTNSINPGSGRRDALRVDVHQLCVAGIKPHDLPGSSDSAIQLTTADGKPATTLPCSNPGHVDNDVDTWPPMSPPATAAPSGS